jgi:predicted dehydrogenase
VSQKASSRRSFLTAMAAAPTLAPVAARALGDNTFELAARKLPDALRDPNERIRIATIGMGIIGFVDTATAIKVPGVELVAIADAYEGRRVHTQEVFGKEVKTYRDYRDILQRNDIDAVLICVPDHWHAQMSVDAMRAGKAVYCEKPMVRLVDEGASVIDVQRETKAVFQVGSHFCSSVLYDKLREIIGSGAIGELNTVEARWNRNTDTGAWQYSIPLDASPETVDWDRFLGNAPKRPFDATRFFRWRNYWDYGTAVAGDLYVHLLTSIHFATQAIGPTKIASMGGLRYWKDGRDVYDMIVSLFDYPKTSAHPAFTVALQSNFVDGSGGGALFRFVGSGGAIDLGFRELTLSRRGIEKTGVNAVLKGYNSVRTFSEAQQEAFAKHYVANQPAGQRRRHRADETYMVPQGYDERFDHFANFFQSMRTNSPVYEDATVGMRAAAPALLANDSYRESRQIEWDPVNLRVPG